MFKIQDILVIC